MMQLAKPLCSIGPTVKGILDMCRECPGRDICLAERRAARGSQDFLAAVKSKLDAKEVLVGVQPKGQG